MITRRLYVIYDNVANDVLGGVHSYPHDAPAIRFFSDIAATAKTIVNTHPQDHDLRCIGILTSIEGKLELKPEDRVVLTGAQLIAAQEGNRQADGVS